MYLFFSPDLGTMISREWDREPHGRRVQRKAIVFILKDLELYESLCIDFQPAMITIFQNCHSLKCHDVDTRTLRRWLDTYMEWGELPYYVKKRKAGMKHYESNMRINEQELLKLKSIVDKNLNHYLDEIALVFGIDTGKFLYPSTIWRYTTERMGYSQQVLSTLAKQQCAEDECRFKQALVLLLQGCPERLITIYETHKNRNATRRQRGWGRKKEFGWPSNKRVVSIGS